jgi:SET domain-containing protein
MRSISIRNSPIHGKGVFAKEPLMRGEYIGRYHGPRTDEDSMYTLWVEHGEAERGYRGTGRLRHLNHSRKPNAEFDNRDLYAIRKIRPEEEIVIHYGDEWDDIP